MIRSTRQLNPRVVLDQAVAELTSAAESIDRLYHDSVSSIALLDASRAIHNALIVLSDLSGSSDNAHLPATVASTA